MRQCTGTRDGGPCKVPPQKGKPWCVHCDPDPEVKAKLAAARKLGGRRRQAQKRLEDGAPRAPHDPPRAPPPPPRTLADVDAYIAWTLDAVATGVLNPVAGNAAKGLLALAAERMVAEEEKRRPEGSAADVPVCRILLSYPERPIRVEDLPNEDLLAGLREGRYVVFPKSQLHPGIFPEGERLSGDGAQTLQQENACNGPATVPAEP